MIKGNQPAAATGLTSNITTKLAANLHIDETGTSGGDWADDDVQMELDDDDINKDHRNSNQDEQGEGWGDSEIELPPDLVSYQISFSNRIIFFSIDRKELVRLVVLVMKMMQADILSLQQKVNQYHKLGHKIRNYRLIMF
jgi:hypothetical protein